MQRFISSLFYSRELGTAAIFVRQV
uniref:Uncharacterized protein n=1 Tax=Anguilla anguilla TaxID=7936 RepID=A0A0E9PEB1_ANGAN